MIVSGSTILAADFISTSAGAGDSGRVPKLDASGKLDSSFIQTKFGGDGSDGALAISSGTTTVDLAGARVVVKNYSSISITGSGKLAFSNPHSEGTIIIIKCQGNMTLTSSTIPNIDARNCGASGGASASQVNTGGNNGSNGTAGKVAGYIQTGAGDGADTSNAGSASATYVWGFWGGVTNTILSFLGKYPRIFVGGGGGSGAVSINSGSGSTSTSGAGGNGGGCLIIECAGYLNFTSTGGISVSGTVGGNGVLGGSVTNGNTGGGGGGGGGFCILLYNFLTAVTGTITSSGGVGGNGDGIGASGTACRGGGAGGSIQGAGNAGSTAGDGVQSGGNGGDGVSLIAQNTDFY